ncbi:hypothetical protein FACS1894124_8070 [Spirochaetia bacterium]|nr:hypothetical protein FACS1894124_8070 [Spirochaetia bacterium]
MILSRIRQVALFLLLPLLSLTAEETGHLDALISALNHAEIPFETRTLNTEHGNAPAASSIWVRISTPARPDQDDAPALFILAIPAGAPSGLSRLPDGPLPFGIEAALAFERQIRERGADRDILIAFLGGESTEGLADLYGALETPEDAILLYLDIPAAPGNVLIYHGSRGTVAPMAIVKPVTALLAGRNIPYSFGSRFNELYKLTLADGPPALEFTQSRELPSILITGAAFPGTGRAPSLSPEIFAELLSDYAQTVKIEIGNADTHYSIYHYGGKTIFVSERVSVVLLLLVGALVLLGILIGFLTRRLRMIFHLRTGIAHFWVSLLYFFALFLVFLAGELLFLGLARLFKVPQTGGLLTAGLLTTGLLTDFMAVYRGLGLAGLTALALFFCFPGPLLTRIHIPGRAGFYGFTALVYSALGFLGSILLNITVAPLFAWILICTVLGMAWQRPLPAFLWAAFSLIRPAGTIASALQSRPLAELFLTHYTAAALIAAAFFLPLLLLLMRGVVLAVPYAVRTKPLFFRIKLAILIVCLGLTVVYVYGLGRL